jgi:hypothetical protein
MQLSSLQNTVKTCILFSVLQQKCPVSPSFKRCVAWSCRAVDQSLSKWPYGGVREWRIVHSNYQHIGTAHHWTFWPHLYHMVSLMFHCCITENVINFQLWTPLLFHVCMRLMFMHVCRKYVKFLRNLLIHAWRSSL